MAPGVTCFSHGPDAREHGQLKAMLREVKAEMHQAMDQDWIKKAKAEPEKEYKSPTQWGPYECLYCVSEAYARFCEQNKDAVPLHGLQANLVLVLRPAEKGELKVVAGRRGATPEASRGIGNSLAKEGLEGIQSWPEGAPPVPQWRERPRRRLIPRRRLAEGLRGGREPLPPGPPRAGPRAHRQAEGHAQTAGGADQ
eukprot:4380663-Pyramimonas_sp.AAC.1